MSNYNSNSSGRRSSRGGRRGSDRNRDQDDRPRDRDRESRSPSTPAPQKKSLWQKFVSIFAGGAKPSGTPAKSHPVYMPRSAESAATRTPQGERTERNERPERTERPRDTAPREPREARKPEAVEVTTPKLYIGNLSFDATESDLSELFNGVGAVVSAEIVAHKHTEKSKGFGFVTMSSVDEAKRAVSELHDKDYMGRKLVVSGAKTPVERE